MTPFWIPCQGDGLEQGDYLPDCWIPLVGEQFASDDSEAEVRLEQRDLIIVTQSCDLANEKNQLAALCPIHPIRVWEEVNPDFARKGVWESVRKGKQEGLHMLAGTETPDDNSQALVVDFRQIYSLPVAYLKRGANTLPRRWRLQSPFREHFSQAFARFFMRVGLPASIPPFK